MGKMWKTEERRKEVRTRIDFLLKVGEMNGRVPLQSLTKCHDDSEEEKTTQRYRRGGQIRAINYQKLENR